MATAQTLKERKIMANDYVQIPRMLDGSTQVMLWDLEEIAPVVMGVLAGMMMDRLFTFMFFGVAVAWVYRRFTGFRQEGLALHFLYRFGLMPVSARTFSNPFKDFMH
jgi:conjugal transfer pilus assembly protein TraL